MREKVLRVGRTVRDLKSQGTRVHKSLVYSSKKKIVSDIEINGE